MLVPWLNYECSNGYLDASKNTLQKKITGKINVSKGKPIKESSEDDNSEDESSDEVFCVV